MSVKAQTNDYNCARWFCSLCDVSFATLSRVSFTDHLFKILKELKLLLQKDTTYN